MCMEQINSPALLVLAAGIVSRYGGLKQIEPVGPHGQTILDYSIYDALRAGFGKVVFVLRKEMKLSFQETVAVRFEKHIPVAYVFQDLDKLPSGFSVPAGRTKPLGTSHSVLMDADNLRVPFAVVNADDFYGAGGYRMLSAHLNPDNQGCAM